MVLEAVKDTNHTRQSRTWWVASVLTTRANHRLPFPLSAPLSFPGFDTTATQTASSPQQHNTLTLRKVSVPVSPEGVSMSGGTRVVNAQLVMAEPAGN